MPVHNALPHLDQAVESILQQTFADFEFVILDDASTDGSGKRLRDWAAGDRRIRLLHADRQLGPVQSSNTVARAARAPLVARMDADDISHTERLREQLEVFKENPGAGLVASLADVVDAGGRRLRGPETWRLMRKSVMVPFAHGAIMYRQDLFETAGGYRTSCEFWEDQDLITRMTVLADALVIPRSLYTVRQTATSTRVISNQEKLEQSFDRMYRCMDRLAKGQTYDDLLAKRPSNRDRIDPRAFIAIGSPVLWSGRKPRLFRRLLQRAELRANFTSATAMIWTGWASLGPSSLRSCLSVLSSLRNLKTRLWRDAPVQWRAGGHHRR